MRLLTLPTKRQLHSFGVGTRVDNMLRTSSAAFSSNSNSSTSNSSTSNSSTSHDYNNKHIGRRFKSTFVPAEPLGIDDLNEQTVKAQYAVRGKIPIIADGLSDLIKMSPTSHGLPFNKIVHANIGNPQQLDQKPLTWYRQVLSILQYPQLLNEDSGAKFPSDVKKRAQEILHNVGSVGAYSSSQGAAYFRQSVAEFITNRDGGKFPANANDIFLTSGASAAVSYLLQLLSQDANSGFLIPIPQYPLYTATIALNDAKPIGYYLDESKGWATNPKEIRQLIKESSDKDIKIKALVVINPGNPTGAILSRDDIAELISIAAEHGIVLIADEVYQENVFSGKFYSFKRILSELKEKDHDQYKNVQLASLHSTSKGVSGECGQRGGVHGACQAVVELMVNPPKKGDESYDLYVKETSTIFENLKKRAEALYDAFCDMEDVSVDKPQGAMYIFPSLSFDPQAYHKLFSRAKNSNLQVDDLYCIELLEHTGICCVPGNGFGQKPGSYHLRTTFLPPGEEWIQRWANFHKDFVKKYKDSA
ncbi:ALT1 [Candida theae]|uniref:ALT1 n=1 Tax=Candida theae TaxID=1198502 RepID=A0AAD5BJ15_9ASCO|nr:ALT1 [Candida theae]KAI5967463.1 ALT1 [Candida theae]